MGTTHWGSHRYQLLRFHYTPVTGVSFTCDPIRGVALGRTWSCFRAGMDLVCEGARGVGERSGGARLRVLTAVVPVWLNRAEHERAHEACHVSALLWNRVISWVREEWTAGRAPGREDIRRHVTSLPAEVRPLHAHTAQAVAYDLADAIALARTNRAQGISGVKFPWREKSYRPLVFTAHFGWKVKDHARLVLSLGKSRERIVLPVPEFADRSGLVVAPDRWGEMKLCWDRAARGWALHISYRCLDDSLPSASGPAAGDRTDEAVRLVTLAVDEGIINSMTLATVAPRRRLRSSRTQRAPRPRGQTSSQQGHGSAAVQDVPLSRRLASTPQVGGGEEEAQREDRPLSTRLQSPGHRKGQPVHPRPGGGTPTGGSRWCPGGGATGCRRCAWNREGHGETASCLMFDQAAAIAVGARGSGTSTDLQDRAADPTHQ